MAARSSLLASHCKSQPVKPVVTQSLRKRLLYVQVHIKFLTIYPLWLLKKDIVLKGLLPALVSSVEVCLLLVDCPHRLPLRLIYRKVAVR